MIHSFTQSISTEHFMCPTLCPTFQRHGGQSSDLSLSTAVGTSPSPSPALIYCQTPNRSSSSSASTRRPAGLLSETVGSQMLSNSQYSKGTGIWHEWSFLVNLTDLSHLWAPGHPARVDSQYSPWSEGFQSRYGYSGSVMLKLPSSFTSQPEVSYFLPSTSITPCFIIHIIFLILIFIKIISWIGS